MYADDQAQIERWCKNPDKFLKVAAMVLCSIRMQWGGVGSQLEGIEEFGSEAACLWGWKREGYRYVRDFRYELYNEVRKYRRGDTYLNDLMREFLKIPGLGLVKAGFLCQLTTGHSGCLDMHNIARFGLEPAIWEIRRRVDPAEQVREVDDKIALYLDLIDRCGGSESLWNEWCEHLNEQVSTFDGAEDVSRRHWEYLI